MGWSYLASLDISGRVLVIWDKRVVELVEECIGHFSVAVSLQNFEDGWRWAFIEVYGPNINSDRNLLWEEMVGIYFLWDLPWCICGDFNFVRL